MRAQATNKLLRSYLTRKKRDPISLASACVIVEATKLRIKQGLITLDEIQVILKNFEPTIKHFDLDLYEQLKELKEERK